MNDKTRAEITEMIARLERISLEEITDNEISDHIEIALEALRTAVDPIFDEEWSERRAVEGVL